MDTGSSVSSTDDFLDKRMVYTADNRDTLWLTLRKNGTISGGSNDQALWNLDCSNGRLRLRFFSRDVTLTATLAPKRDGIWEGTTHPDSGDHVWLRPLVPADYLHHDFSQYGEQRFILEFFAEAPTGYFLDIGAADGVTDSNTRALAIRGWGGTLVEPVPEEFWRLEDAYEDIDGYQLINAAVAEHDGYGTMWIARQVRVEHYGRGDNRHTLDPRMATEAEQWEFRPAQYDRREVRLISPRSLLARLRQPVQFLSVDAEGLDGWIISQLLLNGVRPDLVMFETDKKTSTIAEESLQAAGYREIHATQANAAWAKT